MKFKKDILLALTNQDYNGDDFKVIEQSDWVQDGKCQYQDTIFEFDGKFYRITEGREGSPYTDWYYESEHWDEEVECEEVTKKQVLKYEWISTN